MAGLKLEKFGGQLPGWSPRLLPEGQAALAQNTYLFGGDLVGWRKPKLLRALTNSAATFVYRVPTVTKATAAAYLVFTANVSEGDTVIVDEQTYTFTATVNAAYSVLIGLTSLDSANNLLKALTTDFGTDTGVGTTYGRGTVANAAVDSGTNQCSVNQHDFGSGLVPYLKAVAPDFGAAYNTTRVSSVSSNLVWISDLVLSDTTTLFSGGANASFDSSITSTNVKWLEFIDPDTTVVRSPVVDDKFGRYYFSSPSLPPQYNTYDRIQADDAPWLLGVPAPGCSPGVDVQGGGDTAQLGITDTSGAGYALAPDTMALIAITPEGSMEINDIVIDIVSGTGNAAAVVYTDNAGAPGQLIGVSEQLTSVSGATTFTFLNPVGLTANSQYWIGFFSDAALTVSTPASGSASRLFSATYSNPPPSSAPSTIAGPSLSIYADLSTSELLVARTYVYTYETEYGEESPPSPPTLVNGWTNGVWTVSLWQPPSDDIGVIRNIKTINLYRTVSAIGGQTVYYFVVALPVGTESYVDQQDDSVIALNFQMASTTWFPPPEGLQGIISLPNGMIAGFRNNELWFCEPYRPHAWPPGYVLTTEFPIIGLGVTGQTLVACTAGTPYAAVGVSPATMTLQKISIAEPCISKGSVLSTFSAVYYASPNGLIQISADGTGANMTEGWITREKWKELTPQKNLRAILIGSTYFSCGVVRDGDNSVAQEGYTVELSNVDAKSFGIWPQPGGHRLGFTKLATLNGYDLDNLVVDPWTGIGLTVQNAGVYYFDFSDTSPALMNYIWRSKIYQWNVKSNYSAIKVFFDVPPGTPSQGARNTAAFDDASWATLGGNQYGIFRVYCDGSLVMAREIFKSGEILRVPDGFKYENWQFEIEARVRISNIQIATTAKELAQV